MALLRSSIDSPSPTNIPVPPPAAVASPTGGKAALEKNLQLERENSKLRDLLSKAQEELKLQTDDETLKEGLETELASLKLQLKKNSEEIQAKEDVIRIKDSEISRKDETIAAKISDLSRLSEQLSGAKDAAKTEESRELITLKGELLKARADLSEEQKAKENMMTESASKLKELETKASVEKEKLMVVVAQEVDQVSKVKGEEISALKVEVSQLQAAVSSSQSITLKMTSRLVDLQTASRGLSGAQREVRDRTEKDLVAMRVALLEGFKGDFAAKLRGANKDFLVLKERFVREMLERRRLHNIVSELKGNIRVFMRCRPPTKKELDNFGDAASCVSFTDVPGEVRVFNSEKGRDKSWEFDEVFDLSAGQERVYAEVSPLVTSVLDGFNVCIFAYGQVHSSPPF
jgi:hypothetical protein